MKITENLNDAVKDANGLSLAISIVVAVLIGFFIGKGLYHLTGIKALFWIFLVVGILAAFLNIYKAIKAQQKDINDLVNDPKYKQYKEALDKENPHKDYDEFDAIDKEDKQWNEA